MSTIFVDLKQNKISRQWRWVVKNAGNRKTLATSGESYKNRQDCLDALKQVFGELTTVYLRQPEMGNETLRRPQ